MQFQTPCFSDSPQSFASWIVLCGGFQSMGLPIFSSSIIYGPYVYIYIYNIYIYNIYIYNIYIQYIYIYNIYIYTIYMSMKKMFILMKETIQLLQYPHDYGSFPLFFTVNSALFAAHQLEEVSRSRGFRQKAEEHHHLLVLNGKNHGISMESYKLMVFNGISHIFDVSIYAYIYIYMCIYI